MESFISCKLLWIMIWQKNTFFYLFYLFVEKQQIQSDTEKSSFYCKIFIFWEDGALVKSMLFFNKSNKHNRTRQKQLRLIGAKNIALIKHAVLGVKSVFKDNS